MIQSLVSYGNTLLITGMLICIRSHMPTQDSVLLYSIISCSRLPVWRHFYLRILLLHLQWIYTDHLSSCMIFIFGFLSFYNHCITAYYVVEATSLCSYLWHEFLRKVTHFRYSVCHDELKELQLTHLGIKSLPVASSV